MTWAYVAAWARAFALTQLVEVPIYRSGYGAPLALAFLASAITHPIVWFVIFGPLLEPVEMTYATRVLVAELFAWLTEAGLLAFLCGRPNAIAWALAANAASVAIGFTLRALFGFP